MYDISGFRPQNEKTATLILIVFACMVVAGFAGYLLGIRNVHDHGAGTDAVGNQLAETGTAVQHTKDGIDQAAGTAGAVAETVADAQGTAEYLSGTVNDSAELIRQCQQIIARVRARGKK